MLEVKAGTLDHGFPPITDRSSPENAGGGTCQYFGKNFKQIKKNQDPSAYQKSFRVNFKLPGPKKVKVQPFLNQSNKYRVPRTAPGNILSSYLTSEALTDIQYMIFQGHTKNPP
jgi:hypothetical protein